MFSLNDFLYRAHVKLMIHLLLQFYNAFSLIHSFQFALPSRRELTIFARRVHYLREESVLPSRGEYTTLARRETFIWLNPGNTHYKSIGLDIVIIFSRIISFLSHADLTNLTDGASLRPRLSALPSVFSRMANASVTMRSS